MPTPADLPFGSLSLARFEELPMLVDAAGEFAAAYDACPGMTRLIRPDGYIGWCSGSPSVQALEEFLALFVGTSSEISCCRIDPLR